MPIRVVLAEDDYLVRAGTASLLEDVQEVDLVATVTDLPGLLAAVEEHKPEVVLTDIRMPPTYTNEGIEGARKIRSKHPEIGVVVLTQHAHDEYAHELLKDGARGLGYLLKERVADIDDLVSAIQDVSRGGSLLDPKIVESLFLRKQDDESSLLGTLTAREKDVLELMAQGKTNAAIARAMFLSERAIEKHISTLFDKLMLNEETDVNRRVMAVLTFLKETSGRPSS